MGFAGDHRFNVRWLKEACRILKPEGTIWVTGTHHVTFSIGYALHSMEYELINQITWVKPDSPPNTLHTAFTHERAIRAIP
jgi:site-specific DNA-methyltransferase (adenine-specific)